MTGLAVRDVVVRFGGHEALRGVDLDAPAGAITGLIGPNGAGKTTLFNVICGLQRSIEGTVTLGGVDVGGMAPHRRARAGLGRTFQRLETFGLLTVRENVLAGAEFRRRWGEDLLGGGKGRRSSVPGTGPGDAADELLDRLDLTDVAGSRVDALPTGRARLVELARALAARPNLLLLDEPSSGLDETETRHLGAVLREVAATGLGILLVEHDMALVMDVCDQISVLDFGAVIATGRPDDIRQDPAVRTAYLGDGARTTRISGHRPVAADATTPLLEVRDLRAGYGAIEVLHDVTLSARTGEVFAVVGPNGAGKSTLLGAIGGLVRPRAGAVLLRGHDVTGASADALARAGVCTIPEGRGVFANLSVSDNLWMATGTGRTRDEIESATYERFPRLGERRRQLAGTLSGGEQQMLAMARALVSDPALLVLDELSMGLAPMVVRTLYDEVAALAETGMTIVVVEQFAHEVLGVADRAAILLNGRLGPSGDPDDIADRLAEAYLTGTTS